MNVETHGTLVLAKDVGTNLVVGLHANGDRVPYVAQLMRGLQLNGVVHLTGTGTRLASTGIIYGNAPDGRLDAIFNADGNGAGVIGPFSIERNDGASLYARIALDRPKASVLAIAGAQHFSLLPSNHATLPGIRANALPPLAGTLDAQLIGSLDASQLDGLSGHVRLARFRYGALTADATADLGTGSDGTQRGGVHVRSSLGTLDGNAAYANGLAGFDGHVHGALAGGTVDGPLQALSDGATSALQTSGLQLRDVALAGIPLRDLTATATYDGNRLDVRALQLGIAGGTVTARGALGNGGELTATTSALELPGMAGGTLRAGARVRGTLAEPRAELALLVDRARWHGIDLSGNTFAHYDRGTLQLQDATAIALDSYATAAGTVRGLGGAGAPAVDITANVHGAQIAPLARALRVPLRYPEGEIDADLHVTGPLRTPQLAGTVRVPRGSLNGLNFSNGAVAIAGNTGGVTARDGTVIVGTTAIAFSGEAGPAAQSIAVHAPRVDLADFDDYFDAADTLAGHGHISANAAHSGAGVQANGSVRFEDMRFRRFNVGTVAADWNTRGRTVHTAGSVQTDHGSIALTSDVTFPVTDPTRDVRHRTTIAATGTLSDLDLAQWLPTAGITQPILGIASGSLHVSGTLATPAFDATAAVNNALVHGYALSAFTLALNGNAQSARVSALHVAGPGLTADASGSFGYRASDPVALALHVQSDDVGLLAKSVGAKLDVGGTFTTTANLTGTRNAPRLTDTFDATNLRDGKYTVPKMHAQLAADPNTLNLQTFEADLTRGRLARNRDAADPNDGNARFARCPVERDAARRGHRSRAVRRSVAGQCQARRHACRSDRGERRRKQSSHHRNADARRRELFIESAAFGADQRARARIDLTRTEARLSDAHVDLGGGSIDGTGNATFGDLHDLQRTLALNGQFTAQHAALNVANLFRGTIDGTLQANKPQGDIPTLSGNIAFSKSRLPLAALIPHAPADAETRVPPTVAFNLNVQVGNDVRVTGPGIDIGARGAVAIAGNLAHPELNGRITSTSGTLSFYRTFVLHQATVVFQPSNGLIPNVDATATTTITDPSTSILLHVTGPATNLNLDLASSPSYDKEQILGLLVNAQALGAVPGVETAGGGGISAGSIAGGFLGQEFTQNLLQPIGSGLGQALGFEDLALGYNFGNGLSAGARKQLGKNLYASFNQSFGGDQRQSMALNYSLPHNGAVALTFFDSGNQGLSVLTTQQLFTPVDPTNYTLQALEPPSGIRSGRGASLYQRKFR